MWALFWRLYTAHLFADFPLQTPAVLAYKSRLKGLLIHCAFVFVTGTAVVIPAVFYRPVLLVMVLAITVVHFIVDYLKMVVGQTDARIGLIYFFADQVAHFGTILLFAALFGKNYSFGSSVMFTQFALAVFSIWSGPIIIFIIKQAIKKAKQIGIYREPFAKIALLERVVLFLGLSAQSLWFAIGGIVVAIVIRALLLLNEENVPVPVFEWVIVIVAALVGRLIAYGSIF